MSNHFGDYHWGDYHWEDYHWAGTQVVAPPQQETGGHSPSARPVFDDKLLRQAELADRIRREDDEMVTILAVIFRGI